MEWSRVEWSGEICVPNLSWGDQATHIFGNCMHHVVPLQACSPYQILRLI